MKTILLIVMAGLMAGCGFRNGRPDGSGTIECTQVQVAPLVGGRLLALPVQEGDAVKAGEVVAQIDETDLRLKRNEAAAARAQAQAQLDLLKAGSRAEDIQRAVEDVRQARAQATSALADLARMKEIFVKGSATQKQMDDAQAAADRAAAMLAGAEQTHQKVAKGARKEELAAAAAQLDLAATRLAQADKAVADCTVKAPITGVVTTRTREQGEVVAPGSTLLTLSRLDEVWLSIYVPETRLGRVKLDQPATVRIDGDRTEYAGQVTFISPQAEFTPRNVQTPDERAKLVYRVKVTLKNPDGVFKPGMPADGYLDEQ